MKTDIANQEEYSLIKQLNRIGIFFKYLFYVIILLIITYLIYIFTFELDKLSPKGEKNKYKKAIVNISFNSNNDFKLSQKYLKDYDEVYYNKTNSKVDIKKFKPIYLNEIKNKGNLFTSNAKFDNSILYENKSFYFFKHFKDNDAYKRGSVFTPNLEEAYSGKVVFESFFEKSYLDFINLISGIMLSKELYSYKYSEQIKNIIFETIKKRRTFLTSSYNNNDFSSHETLIKAYSIYYKGENLENSFKTGTYYLANELIADARYFNFDINNKSFEYKINFKEKDFIIFLFKDGKLIRKFKELQFKTDLKKGFYNVVILKNEDTVFGRKELFWIYLNFKI